MDGKWIDIAMLFAGSAIGAYMRYLIGKTPIIVHEIPINVLLINVLGTFVMGVFWGFSEIINPDDGYSFLIAIGFCGSFTTMSGLQYEVMKLIDKKGLLPGLIYEILNMILSLSALIAGKFLTVLVIKRFFAKII